MIGNVDDLTTEERAALVRLDSHFTEWCRGKVQVHRVRAGERAPSSGTLTPETVRAAIRSAVRHLPRAADLEAFIAKRLTLNGESFERWEQDPTVLNPNACDCG